MQALAILAFEQIHQCFLQGVGHQLRAQVESADRLAHVQRVDHRRHDQRQQAAPAQSAG
ncbi:MAG: hypothetical protein WAX67_08915 [Rugosibacter sp.]